MTSTKFTWLFACIGLYIALLITPSGSDRVLNACFDFGLMAPFYWFAVILTVLYIPVPIFLLSGISLLYYFRNNGIKIHGSIQLIHTVYLLRRNKETKLSANIVWYSFLYFIVIAIFWIIYASSKGV